MSTDPDDLDFRDYLRDEERYLAAKDDYEEKVAKELERRDLGSEKGSCGWALESRR